MFVSLPTSSYAEILTPSVMVRASPVALVIKNLPANARDTEMRVWCLGQEDPLEEGMATHSSILA